MNFYHFFIFLLMSLVATLPVIYGRRSDSVELQNRLALFQGVLGPMGLAFGVSYLAMAPLANGWVGFTIYAVEVLLGFLLTYGLVSRYVLRRDDADDEGQTRMTLAKYQAPLGILGISLCALWLSQIL